VNDDKYRIHVCSEFQLILLFTVLDWDKDHVDLAWSQPRRDGGSPVQAYIIEKKPKYG
jgi:hypothetical protein